MAEFDFLKELFNISTKEVRVVEPKQAAPPIPAIIYLPHIKVTKCPQS